MMGTDVTWLDRAQSRELSRHDDDRGEPDRLPLPVTVLIAALSSLTLWAAIWWVLSSLAAAI